MQIITTNPESPVKTIRRPTLVKKEVDPLTKAIFDYQHQRNSSQGSEKTMGGGIVLDY